MKPEIFLHIFVLLFPVAYASHQVILNDDPNCKGINLSSHGLTVEDGCQTFGVGRAQGARLEIDSQSTGHDDKELETDSVSILQPDPSSLSTFHPWRFLSFSSIPQRPARGFIRAALNHFTSKYNILDPTNTRPLTALLFYNTPTCNSTSGDIIASTDSSCVAIGGRFNHNQTFQSFRLVSPAMSKAGERMGWKANNAALLRHGLTWEDLENQGEEMHGRISVTGGKVYKYQQLSREAWTGIPIEEWDEDVHIKHDEI